MFSVLSTNMPGWGCSPLTIPYLAALITIVTVITAVFPIWITVQKRKKKRRPDKISPKQSDRKEETAGEMSSLEKLMKMKVSRTVRLRKELDVMQLRFPEKTDAIRKLNEDIEELELQIRVYFRRIILYQLEIQQKLADLGKDEPGKRFMEKVEHIIYEKQGKMSWEKIYEMMPDGFIETLKGKNLNQTELRICCLHYYYVGYDEMMSVMKMAKNTLYSVNHHIRKKLSIPAADRIGDFFRQPEKSFSLRRISPM
jgi:hypothetical protein